MTFLIVLLLCGTLLYLVNPNSGALLIAAGCALAVVRWLAPKIGAKWLIE